MSVPVYLYLAHYELGNFSKALVANFRSLYQPWCTGVRSTGDKLIIFAVYLLRCSYIGFVSISSHLIFLLDFHQKISPFFFI